MTRTIATTAGKYIITDVQGDLVFEGREMPNHTPEHFDLPSKFAEVLGLLNRANFRLFILNAKVNKLMSKQDDLDTIVQAEVADLAIIVKDVQTVKDQVTAAIAANPAIDLSGLKDAEATLSAIGASVLAIVPSTPAVTEPAPSA